jgi:hypothetical protein
VQVGGVGGVEGFDPVFGGALSSVVDDGRLRDRAVEKGLIVKVGIKGCGRQLEAGNALIGKAYVEQVERPFAPRGSGGDLRRVGAAADEAADKTLRGVGVVNAEGEMSARSSDESSILGMAVPSVDEKRDESG